MQNRIAVVTGGSGFIGQALSLHLTHNQDVVHILDLATPPPALALSSIRYSPVDVRNAHDLCEAISSINPDVVFHLAALSTIPACEDQPTVAFETNVVGTANLINAVSPGSRVVFVSSAAIYSASPEDKSENSEVAPIDVYGQTKAQGADGAAEIVAAGKERGIHTIIARLFNVIGPGDCNGHLVPDVIHEISRGMLRVGNLDTIRDFTHVRDISEALMALSCVALNNDGDGIFNVGSGVPTSTQAVVDLLQTITGTMLTPTVSRSKVRRNDRERLVAITDKLRCATSWSPRRKISNAIAEAWEYHRLEGSTDHTR